MTTLARMTGRHADPTRRSTAAMVSDQVGYAVRELWRSRIVLIFTFVLPLVWLVLIGFMAGNEPIDETSGVSVMQFATPMAAALGLLFSTFPPVAYSLALAREHKIVKRLRGTPLPMWAYLLGKVGAAVVLAAASIATMLAIGVIAYGVQLQVRTALAMVMTLILGVASLSAIGLAVGALARSGSMAQTFSIAAAVVVWFLSGLMTMGLTPPDWMEATASVFPIRHVVRALQEQFDPFASGAGWDPVALAVLVAWGVAGVLIAAWALRREPRSAAAPAAAHERAAARGSLRALEPGRPSAPALVVQQLAWASTTVRRDPGWVFFAVGMPIGLYALMASQMGGSGFEQGGLPFNLFFAVGMAVYGAAVTAFLNMPEAVATARDRGLLKRLRGTPLAPWQYLAGRTAAVLWIGILTGILVFAVGILAFGVAIHGAAIPLALAVFLLGTLTLAACGYAVAAVAPSGRAIGVIGLAILLPLSFLSDIFPMGSAMPDLLTTLGSMFPLRHFVHALTAAVHPDGPSVAWPNLAVMTAWLVATTVIAVRRFTWEPRR